MQASAEQMFASGVVLDQASHELLNLRRALALARREIAELRTLAECDCLTGLANRHRLMTEIGTAIARRNNYGWPAALFFIDMDQLKYLNDHFGHAAGDAAIAHVARIIRESLPQGFAARLGGDEFAIVLTGVTKDMAEDHADIIARNIADSPLWHDGRRHHLAISIGIATIEQGDTARTLLTRADAAMYADKRCRLQQNQAARSAR